MVFRGVRHRLAIRTSKNHYFVSPFQACAANSSRKPLDAPRLPQICTLLKQRLALQASYVSASIGQLGLR